MRRMEDDKLIHVMVLNLVLLKHVGNLPEVDKGVLKNRD